MAYGMYCWANVRTVSPWRRIQTPVERGSNNFSELLPETVSASWPTVIVVDGVQHVVMTPPRTSAGTR